MTKRLLGLLLVVFATVIVLPTFATKTKAAKIEEYNLGDTMTYAERNWNSGPAGLLRPNRWGYFPVCVYRKYRRQTAVSTRWFYYHPIRRQFSMHHDPERLTLSNSLV